MSTSIFLTVLANTMHPSDTADQSDQGNSFLTNQEDGQQVMTCLLALQPISKPSGRSLNASSFPANQEAGSDYDLLSGFIIDKGANFLVTCSSAGQREVFLISPTATNITHSEYWKKCRLHWSTKKYF